MPVCGCCGIAEPLGNYFENPEDDTKMAFFCKIVNMNIKEILNNFTARSVMRLSLQVALVRL